MSSSTPPKDFSFTSSKKISTLIITAQRYFNFVSNNSRDFNFFYIASKNISTLEAPPRDFNFVINNKKIEKLY
jgi:hypothetical protein